jgi:hypothetical protein
MTIASQILAMSRPLRILTFGWQPDHLRLLARTGSRWDVVPRVAAHLRRPWALSRLLPENANVVPLDVAEARMRCGTYDRILCWAPADVAITAGSTTPTLLFVTRPAELGEALGWRRHSAARFLQECSSNVTLLYPTPSVARSYGVPGTVLRLGLEPEHYPAYEGTLARVCIVGRMFDAMPLMTGVATLGQVTVGIPFVMCDSGEPLPGFQSLLPPDARFHAYRDFRTMLWATPACYTDGNDPLVLEAMAVGIPIVSVPQPEGVPEDGVSGFVCAEAEQLRARVVELLGDHTLAQRLSDAARDHVRTKFPFIPFSRQWADVVDSVRVRNDTSLFTEVS